MAYGWQGEAFSVLQNDSHSKLINFKYARCVKSSLKSGFVRGSTQTTKSSELFGGDVNHHNFLGGAGAVLVCRPFIIMKGLS